MTLGEYVAVSSLCFGGFCAAFFALLGFCVNAFYTLFPDFYDGYMERIDTFGFSAICLIVAICLGGISVGGFIDASAKYALWVAGGVQ